MSPLEELLHRRWIIKEQDVDLYYRVKDALKDIRKSIQEKFGYIITLTPYLIKLEKIPGKAETWMGIQDFQSVKEYQMFCYVLMFLEDKEREEQFVLSSLTEYIQMQFTQGNIEWTDLTTRRQLIRVMKYCISSYLLKKTDGNEDLFATSMNSEVLYENTGLSRYMLRNFMKEVMEYNEPSDFEKSEWLEMDEDRGIVRRQRVYRRLLLSPGVYRSDNNDDDFLYIRNYRNQIQNDFQSFFPSNLHIHSSSAYLNLEEDCMMGKVFPFNNSISDLILVTHDEIRKRIKSGQYKLSEQEQLIMEQDKFLSLCEKIASNRMMYLPKKYQEIGPLNVAMEIVRQMKQYGFIEDSNTENMIKINPICGKISGGYSNE